MSDPKLTVAQKKAAIDYADQSMSLRSGAGCGKTFVLARRYTQLLNSAQEETSPLRRLVAMTFTDKAAIEMSQRVALMLTEQAQQATGSQKAQLRRWIDELPEARISTIHSFCASLLRAHAIEAGIDPSFALCADNLLMAQLLEEACDAVLLEAAESGDPQLTYLLGYLPYQAIIKLLTTLMSQRQLIEPENYRDGSEVMAAWNELLKRERQAAWERLENDSAISDLASSISAEPCGEPQDKLLIKREELMPVINAIISDPSARTPANFTFACK
ncbi:MAG: UvrD-helicase domain-containing protein, partial [bacterium]|nr:UvrD-helicase domain-containing protein [bacterium]